MRECVDKAEFKEPGNYSYVVNSLNMIADCLIGEVEEKWEETGDEEIKFRTYDKQYGRFIYSDWKHGTSEFWTLVTCDWTHIYSKPEQFTTLRDKEGRAIYKGDIVSNGKVTGPVIWGIAGWTVEDDPEHGGSLQILAFNGKQRGFQEGVLLHTEIVGNIHEVSKGE